MNTPHTQNGRLLSCPRTLNCVCSEEEGSRNIAPLDTHGKTDLAWQQILEILKQLGGRIEHMDTMLIHASFRSRLFRFVDDVSCRLDLKQDCIQIRSSSRTGYWDLGVNRRRVHKIRQLLDQFLGSS